MVMPLMGGKLLAEKMIGLRTGIKVLYMSGYSENTVIHHGILEFRTGFIGKPFSVEALACKVREVLDASQTSI